MATAPGYSTGTQQPGVSIYIRRGRGHHQGTGEPTPDRANDAANRCERVKKFKCRHGPKTRLPTPLAGGEARLRSGCTDGRGLSQLQAQRGRWALSFEIGSFGYTYCVKPFASAGSRNMGRNIGMQYTMLPMKPFPGQGGSAHCTK